MAAGFMWMAINADNSRMTFQAVLFDCDGVLVDSEAITLWRPARHARRKRLALELG